MDAMILQALLYAVAVWAVVWLLRVLQGDVFRIIYLQQNLGIRPRSSLGAKFDSWSSGHTSRACALLVRS